MTTIINIIITLGLTYLTLVLIAVLLDQSVPSDKISAKANQRIDDFVHAVFFDFHHFS